MPIRFGSTELIIILVIVLILFGVGRIGRIGGELGKGIREFRRGIRDTDINGENNGENNDENSDEESDS